MMKIWSNREALLDDAENGEISENPEKYISTKMCFCGRFCPQSYSKSRPDLIHKGVNETKYNEILSCIDTLDGEFTVDRVVNQMWENKIITDKIYWVDRHSVREILQAMNCEGELSCRLAIVPDEKDPKKTHSLQLFTKTFGGQECEFRKINRHNKRECMFDFRKDGTKLSRNSDDGGDNVTPD